MVTPVKIKNTFAISCENEELTINQVVILLFRQLVKYSDLPLEVQDLVDQHMKDSGKNPK